MVYFLLSNQSFLCQHHYVGHHCLYGKGNHKGRLRELSKVIDMSLQDVNTAVHWKDPAWEGGPLGSSLGFVTKYFAEPSWS